jgi:hypothetical protein
VNSEHDTQETEKTTNEQTEKSQDTASSERDGEFKVTVRKLEMPVRPRGVLAE